MVVSSAVSLEKGRANGKTSGTLPPVLFIMGPTASGKTTLAVELVRRFPFEIISVDSAQLMVSRLPSLPSTRPRVSPSLH